MTAQDGVLDLVQRWAAAEQDNDAGRLDGLLAGGFAGVGPFGFILTRDQWLARFTNGLVNRSFAVTDLQVRDFGTAAVGIGVLAQETSWQGTDNSGRFRVTLVAVQAGEGWQLAHVHIGPLQAPPGRPS
jgi:ketosteroid isomerase-like protein